MFLGKQADGTGEDKSILSIEREVALLKEVRWQVEYYTEIRRENSTITT